MSGGKSKPKKYRNAERERKRTNVGGRPPARGIIPRKIPRGLEVLIKKAAVDPAFKKLLLEKRAGAAGAIGLKLTAAEEAMLAAVPLPQLEGIIAHTRISPNLRPAFLGYAAGAMLAALGTAVGVCRIRNGSDADKVQDENLSANAVVEKTIRIMDMPTAGIRPSGRGTAAQGYVVLVAGEAANYKTRRIDYIQNRMKPVYSNVKSEYAAYLIANPGAKEGDITVRFTITARGRVANPEIILDSIGSPEFRAKVLSQVALWKIDPVETGVVKVVYKFNFRARSEFPSTGVAPEVLVNGPSFAELLPIKTKPLNDKP